MNAADELTAQLVDRASMVFVAVMNESIPPSEARIAIVGLRDQLNAAARESRVDIPLEHVEQFREALENFRSTVLESSDDFEAFADELIGFVETLMEATSG